MTSKGAIVGSFIKDAPPGELHEVVKDIKALTSDQPSLLQSQTEAFKTYNEEQFTTVKLPGGVQEVLISRYNSLPDGRYYDTESKSSFAFDHQTQKASSVQSHSTDSQHSALVDSTLKALSKYAAEHFPSASYGVYPTDNDSSIAIVLVANKYSPNNFWNGRWRSHYTFKPSSSSALTGMLHIDVHYYEDGNVRLLTEKPMSLSTSSSANGTEIIRAIATAEKQYQEELNRAFVQLSEGAFKGLRRQLPVTRQKIEWERISGYRIGQSLQGAGR